MILAGGGHLSAAASMVLWVIASLLLLWRFKQHLRCASEYSIHLHSLLPHDEVQHGEIHRVFLNHDEPHKFITP